MSVRITVVALGCVAGLAVAGAASAQARGALAGSEVSQAEAHAKTGVWRPTTAGAPYGKESGFGPAEIKTVYDSLEKILDVLGETSVLKAPVGFEAHALYTAGSGRAPKNQLPGSKLSLLLFDYLRPCATCPIAPVGESGAMLHVWINTLDDLSGCPNPPGKDAAGVFCAEPHRLGQFAGFPLYDCGNEGPCFVIAKDPTRPLWLPVSRERWIKARIAPIRDSLKTAKPPWDQSRRADIAELEAALAAMSPAERASQAIVAGRNPQHGTWLAQAGDPTGAPLVTANPAFFDLSRPITSFQLAVVSAYPMGLLGPRPPTDFMRTKLLDLIKEADWKRVAALLQ
jgi:hypothetical protein